MYGHLPRPLVSTSGFQGCFSSFETNGELLDPVKHALVPSPLVEEGCEGTDFYMVSLTKDHVPLTRVTYNDWRYSIKSYI